MSIHGLGYTLGEQVILIKKQDCLVALGLEKWSYPGQRRSQAEQTQRQSVVQLALSKRSGPGP